MKNSTLHHRSGRGGFTLIEILVSITVLGLMMIGVAQMLNSTMIASTGGFKHMDADTQARMVLDRMALDISKISRRGDVDCYFQKNTNGALPGNDQMAFFSESSGYFPSGVTASTQGSDMSLVGYRISGNQLQRLSKGLVWNGVSTSDNPMVFGAPTAYGTLINSAWPNVEGTGNDTDYQIIGDQIFRLEYTFLVSQPTNASLYPASTTSIPGTTSTYLTDVPYAAPDTVPNGMQDVVAIVVSIAVLDSESQKIATTFSPTSMTTAALDLEDVAASPIGSAIATSKLPLTRWKADLASSKLGLPKVVAGQVRFYQRYCYINHAQ